MPLLQPLGDDDAFEGGDGAFQLRIHDEIPVTLSFYNASNLVNFMRKPHSILFFLAMTLCAALFLLMTVNAVFADDTE